MAEEISGTFDSEVDVNDDAFGKSRFEDVRKSPVEWGAFEGTFAHEVEATNSRTHVKEYFFQKSSKIHNYTRRAHVLRDVSNTFRERTCKHESKRKSYESSERRFNYLSHRLKNLQSRKSTRSNRKTRCVQRSQSLDKLGRSRVCCDV